MNKTATPKKRQDIENMYPLSPLQEGFLFHALLNEDQGLYAPQVIFTLQGRLDSQALKDAWQQAISRHPILRSSFYWEQREQPFQVVYKTALLDWQEEDWRELTSEQQRQRRQQLQHDNRSVPFNLQKPSLMRLQLLHVDDDTYQLVWCYHHLILDGWSSAQLFKDVFQCYLKNTGELPHVTPPPKPFADYIAWLKAQDKSAAKRFWDNYLHGIDGGTQLLAPPSSQSETTNNANAFEEYQIVFDTEQSQRINEFCQARQITLNTLMQACLGLLLGQYTRSRDVIFGYTTSGRPSSLPGAANMVGLFINTLPIRITLPADATASGWLQTLQSQQAEVASYEFLSLREIQQQTNKGNALFDCLLVFESYPVDREAFAGQQSLSIKNLEFEEWTHYPLTLLVVDNDEIRITAKYQTSRLSTQSLQQLMQQFQHILTTMLTQPEQVLSQLTAINEQDWQQQLRFNATQTDYSGPATLTDWLEQQRQVSATLTAIICDQQTLSYEQLHQRADVVCQLLQAQGIGPEDHIALYMHRSVELMMSVLAIMKAGAVYVPVEPEYPEERRRWILEDSQASIILTDSRMALPPIAEQAPTHTNTTRVDLASIDFSKPATQLNRAELSPQHAAYTIYTSGSTGKPKGVVNTHQGIVNRLNWMQAHFQLTNADRVLLKTPLGFDVSVWELFWPLITGATLVIARPGGHKDPQYLIDMIQQHIVTTLHFVPPMLSAFLEHPDAASCRQQLQQVILSGEALSSALQQRFFQLFGNDQTTLHNLYGPTEAAIDVTAWHCRASDADNIPIGYPIANTQIYLLDDAMNPVPHGVAGELHIGGSNLARGYYNRPDLTAERFVPNPFASDDQPHSLLYKTGDLARYREDGAIEYLGRLDHQVKIRGVRIELGEVETVLAQHPLVQEAIAVTFAEGTGDDNNHALAAFFTLPTSSAPTDNEALLTTLRGYLEQQLPTAMVPTSLTRLDAMPLTPNGKPDRKVLQQNSQRVIRQAADYVAPSTDTEKVIAAIWRELLTVDKPGKQDNFFDLGGHSLIATRVVSRLRKHFDLDIPLKSLFERATLTELASYIDALRISQHDSSDIPDNHQEIDLF